jgi:hypothetical protein
MLWGEVRRTKPATIPGCPPGDPFMKELVRQGNHGSDVPGLRVTQRECGAGYVIASLDSDVGRAVALLPPRGVGFEAAVVGSDVCGAPQVRQAPAESGSACTAEAAIPWRAARAPKEFSRAPRPALFFRKVRPHARR